MSEQVQINEVFWACETFIIIKKPNVRLEGGWKKDDNGLVVPLDFPCYIFHENESEEFQNFLDMVNAFAKPESDKSLPKFNAGEYDEFTMYLKRIKILNNKVVSHNELSKMFMKELHQKHNDNQTLKSS